MHHSLAHPCTSKSGAACCGLAHASFNLRFQSFVSAPQGMLLMAYEVCVLQFSGAISPAVKPSLNTIYWYKFPAERPVPYTTPI